MKEGVSPKERLELTLFFLSTGCPSLPSKTEQEYLCKVCLQLFLRRVKPSVMYSVINLKTFLFILETFFHAITIAKEKESIKAP